MAVTLQLNSTYTGELIALLAAFLWAISSIIYSRVGIFIPPYELNLIKGLLALVFVSVVLLAGQVAQADVPWLGLLALGLSGAVGIGLGDTAYFQSMQDIGPGRASLIKVFSPPLASLVAVIFLGERLQAGIWVGIFLTILGVAMVLSDRAPQVMLGSGRMGRGIFFGLLASLCEAIGVVLARGVLVQTGIHPLWSTAWRLLGAVLVLAAWAAITRPRLLTWRTMDGAGRLFGLTTIGILLGTFLGIVLQQVALSLAAAGIVTTLITTSPLFILLLVALIWRQPVRWRALLGVIVALLGIAWLFLA